MTVPIWDLSYPSVPSPQEHLTLSLPGSLLQTETDFTWMEPPDQRETPAHNA